MKEFCKKRYTKKQLSAAARRQGFAALLSVQWLEGPCTRRAELSREIATQYKRAGEGVD